MKIVSLLPSLKIWNLLSYNVSTIEEIKSKLQDDAQQWILVSYDYLVFNLLSLIHFSIVQDANVQCTRDKILVFKFKENKSVNCRWWRFRKRCKLCKIRKNQRRNLHMCKKQLKSQMQMQMQMQMNEIWLSRNSRQNHKKYCIMKEDSLSISKMRTERWRQWKCEIQWITHWKRRKSI